VQQVVTFLYQLCYDVDRNNCWFVQSRDINRYRQFGN